MSGIVSLEAAAARPETGGKARGLGRLLAHGFPVPRGVVVLPGAQPDEILAAYATLGRRCVAVRSSAVEEDAAYLSYAGQFDTILDISGDAALIEAIARCRQSGTAGRAAAYRDALAGSNGVTTAASGPIPVIVQEMVQPEYAGVAFVEEGGAVLVEGVRGLAARLVSGTESAVPLPPEIRETVEQLARRVAEALGGAQDLEWAAAGSRVWLLQARPLTAPLPASLPARVKLWTAANVQEAVPQPLTPFSEEATLRFLNRVTNEMFATSGLDLPAEPTVRLVHGRFYMSCGAMLAAASTMPGGRPAEMMRFWGDSPELAQVVDYQPGSRWRFLARLPVTAFRMGGWLLFAGRRIQRARSRLSHLTARVETVLGRMPPDNGELMTLLDELVFDRAGLTQVMALCTGIAFMPLGFLMQAAGLLGRPIAEVAALGSTSEMESMQPATQLTHLASWLRENASLDDSHPAVQERLEQFLNVCGFRSDNEAEFANPRWCERREEVLRMARQLARLSPGSKQHRAAALPAWIRALLWPLARSARKWQVRREASRAIMIRQSNLLRRLLLHIARSPQTGLAEPQDVFYLLADELFEVLRGRPASNYAAVIERRKQRHQRLLRRPALPRLLAELPHGRLVPFALPPSHGDLLQGAGVSPGRATGRARVLATAEQGTALEPGEVLVARSTDVGWTPLFTLAAAVVTEIGAPSSHTAIVAREMGLPAVVNVSGAMTSIRTGDMLFVDGWAGTVRVFSPELEPRINPARPCGRNQKGEISAGPRWV